MGASFMLFKRDPEYDVDMSYRAVHICRMELLKLVDLDGAYSSCMANTTEEYWNTHLLGPIEMLIQSQEPFSKESECALGLKEFVDHSDCEGLFYTEGCGYIATAFETYLNHPELHDDPDGELMNMMKDLAKIFREAHEHDGIVHIF